MTNGNEEMQQTPEISTSTRTKAIQTRYDYCDLLKVVEERGREFYGAKFRIEDIDRPPVSKILCYFLQDQDVASHAGIDLGKGLMITGPIGCGKSAIMHIMSSLCAGTNTPSIVACRELSYAFCQNGYEVIRAYSREAFYRYTSLPYQPVIYCFDDMGLETQASYWGNRCQVVAEILYSRYELFVSDGMITHVTTNLNAKEMEEIYGSRLRSRMRQMLNLVPFHPESRDKRR